MSLDLLTELIGSDVIRIDPNGRKTVFSIKTRPVAEYLHGLQKHGYKLETV